MFLVAVTQHLTHMGLIRKHVMMETQMQAMDVAPLVPLKTHTLAQELITQPQTRTAAHIGAEMESEIP